jgi:hypothetical protein
MNQLVGHRFWSLRVALILALVGSSTAFAESSLWASLADFLGLSATPGAVKKSGDELTEGTIWIADLADNTQKQLTKAAIYRSPVFVPPSGTAIVALDGEKVIRISLAGGEAEVLWTVPGITKLVGFDRAETGRVLVLTLENGAAAVGVLSLSTGLVTKIAHNNTEADSQALAHLMGWERVYGDKRLFVEKHSREDLAGAVEWIDIMLVSGGAAPRNVSRCDGVDCGQPSLSADGTRAVYVKAP